MHDDQKLTGDSGNTWDQIAKHMNELTIATARGVNYMVKYC